MKNMPELNNALKGRNGANQCMYSTASGRSRSELPSSRATSRAQEVIRKLYAARRSDDTATACVTLMRAALTFPCARWIDATTDAPTPNISPTPVLMRNSGAVMLTAASASLPDAASHENPVGDHENSRENHSQNGGDQQFPKKLRNLHAAEINTVFHRIRFLECKDTRFRPGES